VFTFSLVLRKALVQARSVGLVYLGLDYAGWYGVVGYLVNSTGRVTAWDMGLYGSWVEVG
jgi:hypothetical protein